MRWLRSRAYDLAARVLTKPRARYALHCRNDVSSLRRAIRKGDVVLVDGDQRVSEVIKYLTQSSWSHSALYVGDELLRRFPSRRAELVETFGDEAQHLIIEALLEGGVVASPLSKYVQMNMRVCRPHALRTEDLQRVLDEVVAQLGERYDVRNIVDLGRYFFPVSLIPAGLRRRALQIGSGRPTEVICSSLIARAFQNVGFPILPEVEWQAEDAPVRWRDRLLRRPAPYPALFRRQLPALITPRDFDLSPYFHIVKFNGAEAQRFDYRRIRWA